MKELMRYSAELLQTCMLGQDHRVSSSSSNTMMETLQADLERFLMQTQMTCKEH